MMRVVVIMMKGVMKTLAAAVAAAVSLTRNLDGGEVGGGGGEGEEVEVEREAGGVVVEDVDMGEETGRVPLFLLMFGKKQNQVCFNPALVKKYTSLYLYMYICTVNVAPTHLPFTGNTPGPNVPASCQAPEECFSLFLDDNLWTFLVDSTNQYATKRKWSQCA